MRNFAIPVFLLLLISGLYPGDVRGDEAAEYPHLVSVDAGGVVRWLGDPSLLVLEVNYRYMPGMAGLDLAFAYRTSAATFEDLPLINAYVLYVGPVLGIGEWQDRSGPWLRARAAAAYGRISGVYELEDGTSGPFFDDNLWFGGTGHAGYSLRRANGRFAIEPYIGFQYLFGYFFPGFGAYLGYAF
ncbi:MAG: hypothetical protein EA383_00245 [Spirochaetaceae bacterium]|nr:MAG: hypothetical protein EA383_00245 [Spirochaetaceae bacterium]